MDININSLIGVWLARIWILAILAYGAGILLRIAPNKYWIPYLFIWLAYFSFTISNPLVSRWTIAIPGYMFASLFTIFVLFLHFRVELRDKIVT